MNQFDVYPRNPVSIVKGEGPYVFDEKGTRYLDLYGGHAVVSIGHSHPHYVQRICDQLHQLAFYSNSVILPIQEQLAEKLGKVSEYPDYQLFLCNSGAEAIENALKLASFHTGRKKIVAIEKAFHGRTSLAIAVTDDKKIQAPVNQYPDLVHVPLNDVVALEQSVDESVAAIIIEGVQGIGGIHIASAEYLQLADQLAKKYGAMLILDEIQSGYGRTGKFFAHQHTGICPDMITIAKGMGNGFPIGGVMIHPAIKPWPGMLGTTFGGSPLACAAALAVLEVIESEQLISHAATLGEYLLVELSKIDGITVRGKGLMVGIDLPEPSANFRKKMLLEHRIFLGSSNQPQTLRILPPLNIEKSAIDQFLTSFKTILQNEAVSISS